MEKVNFKVTNYGNGKMKYVMYKALQDDLYIPDASEEFFLEASQTADITTSIQHDEEFLKVMEEDSDEEMNFERLENLKSSLWRTRRILKDILLSNFNKGMFFVTLTNRKSSPEYADQSIDQANEEFRKQILKKCQNLVERYSIKYILVPELTKRGYVHFHGIFWDIPKKWLRDSGHKDKTGRKIWNLVKFDNNGFSTCTKISTPEKCFTYVTKYMTKEMSEKKGFRRFYHSRNVFRPEYYYTWIDFEVDDIFSSQPAYENERVAIWYFK